MSCGPKQQTQQQVDDEEKPVVVEQINTINDLLYHKTNPDGSISLVDTLRIVKDGKIIVNEVRTRVLPTLGTETVKTDDDKDTIVSKGYGINLRAKPIQ